VIAISEPFNFSRLNNLALERSKAPADFNTVLFLNNDVELNDDCLLEMSRWMDQPKVGCVGARLHYPNKLLQHGGVMLNKKCPADEMIWYHIDHGRSEEHLSFAAVINVPDAITGACMMIKKEVFNEIGGFDAVNYPIAYSDTNLCQRLTKKGYYSLYTPYAVGIHHESATRKYNNIEDFEQSSWLAKNTV
jgi:GT2 family glycosyltransferase